ncbi:Trk system potassium transporter TrkA [Acidobacteriota bacterium]
MSDSTVIIGAGEIGLSLARTLSLKKKDVILIDHDEEKLGAAEDLIDVETLLGHGGSAETLKKAGADKAALTVAVTDVDEVNMISAMTAKLLGTKRTVARIRSHVYLSGTRSIYRDVLGIDIVVSPEIISALKLIEIHSTPGAVWVENFAQRQVRLLTIHLNDDFPYLGIPLAELKRPVEFVLAAVLRGGKIIIPKGDDCLQSGDHVYLVTVPENVETVRELVNSSPVLPKKVMIYGGSSIGVHLATLLQRQNMKVRLMEPELKKCREIAGILDKTEVVQGDATDPSNLKEENVSTFDTLMAVSVDDKANLIACLLAKELGVKSCSAVVQSQDFLDLAESFKADVVISPRTLASSVILKLIMKSHVVSVAQIENGKAEILEIIGTSSGSATGVPLKDALFPPGVVIGAILKKGKVIIPSGEDTIDEGDHAIVFVLPEVVEHVERLFGA